MSDSEDGIVYSVEEGEDWSDASLSVDELDSGEEKLSCCELTGLSSEDVEDSSWEEERPDSCDEIVSSSEETTDC